MSRALGLAPRTVFVLGCDWNRVKLGSNQSSGRLRRERGLGLLSPIKRNCVVLKLL